MLLLLEKELKLQATHAEKQLLDKEILLPGQGPGNCAERVTQKKTIVEKVSSILLILWSCVVLVAFTKIID